jgi:hypothetical protein
MAAFDKKADGIFIYNLTVKSPDIINIFLGQKFGPVKQNLLGLKKSLKTDDKTFFEKK